MGKTTVFTVGLAVTLTLLLGVTTAALAAVPGDPFKLGRLNTINAVSRLAGNVAGPMLTVDNNSSAANARALEVQVEPGRAPLVVSTGAGKATNLNADALDGKDSGDFLGDTYFRFEDTYGGGGAGGWSEVFVWCDEGDQVLGGGYHNADPGTHIVDNGPWFGTVQGWYVGWRNDASKDELTVFAICSDTNP